MCVYHSRNCPCLYKHIYIYSCFFKEMEAHCTYSSLSSYFHIQYISIRMYSTSSLLLTHYSKAELCMSSVCMFHNLFILLLMNADDLPSAFLIASVRKIWNDNAIVVFWLNGCPSKISPLSKLMGFYSYKPIIMIKQFLSFHLFIFSKSLAECPHILHLLSQHLTVSSPAAQTP